MFKKNKLKTITSAIALSMLLSACGSDSSSSNNQNSNNDSNSTAEINENDPLAGIKLTDKNTFKAYSFEYQLSSTPNVNDTLTKTLFNVKEGKVLNTTSINILAENKQKEDTIVLLGDKFFSQQNEMTTQKQSLYGLDKEYLVLQDRKNNKKTVLTRSFKEYDLSDTLITDVENNAETPLSIFSLDIKYPNGSTCWSSNSLKPSQNFIISDFEYPLKAKNVQEFIKNDEGSKYITVQNTQKVGTNNELTANILTYKYPNKDEFKMAITEIDNKLYQGRYLESGKDNTVDYIECDYYNKTAADFITSEVEKLYNK